MVHCFDESHRAHEEGNEARAKELSNKGKRHKSEMERLDKEASDWIFYRKLQTCIACISSYNILNIASRSFRK